jgi:hypothetical protein
MNSNITPHSRTRPASKTGLYRPFRRLCVAAALGLGLAAVNTTYAQVSTINSAILQPRIIDNLTNADLTTVSDYPTNISFTETDAGTTNTAFSRNQDLWQFSNDGGLTAYSFQSNDSFTVSMNVTLTGNPIAPRKEAGFAINDVDGNIAGFFILDTDAHEVVAFGGPFWNSNPFNAKFQSGQTVTLAMTLFLDNNGKQAIIYSANGFSSPALEVSPPFTNYTLGGYFQIQGQDTALTNSGSADFQNISIGTPLGIAASGANSAVVYWPASATNYVLQTATNINSTNWTAVIGQPVTGVLVPNTTPPSFFRLQAQ